MYEWQVSGFDALRQSCIEITSDLSFFNDIILDVSDFRKAAVFLLKDIAASTLQHYKVPTPLQHFRLHRSDWLQLLVTTFLSMPAPHLCMLYVVVCV